jgi:hypothetical protein
MSTWNLIWSESPILIQIGVGWLTIFFKDPYWIWIETTTQFNLEYDYSQQLLQISLSEACSDNENFMS